MTIIIGVLVALAVIALVIWWMLDFEMPEVMIPVAAPGAGAGLIYWYGTPLAWAAGIALFLVAAAVVFFLVRRSREQKAAPPK